MKAQLLAVALIASVLSAQHAVRLKWGLPERGLAVYDHDESWRIHLTKSTRKPPPAAVHPFGNVRHTAVLLDSELAETRDHVADGPLGIEGVAPWIALDLRTAGGKRDKAPEADGPVKLAFRLPAVAPFGDLVFDGEAGTPTEDGTQKLELTVRRVPIVRGRESESDFIHWREHLFDWQLSGTLMIVRHVDRERGRVTRFDSTFEVLYNDLSDSVRLETAMRYEQHWKLRALLGHHYPGFQERVNEAIRRGRAWIRKRIYNPRLHPLDVDTEASRGAGTLALALLTLLTAEVPASDTVVEQGFVELRKREIHTTYPLALAIMAIEGLYAPPGERRLLLDGQIECPLPRELSAVDRRLVHGWTERLLGNRDTSVDAAYRSRWNYTPAPRFDNSNTQYALLGLYSAHRCGVEISPGVWVSAANHLLENQNPAEGPARPLTLTTYAQAEQLLRLTPSERRRRTIGAGSPAAPRGWGYWDDEDQLPYGAMSAAGVSGLSICAAGMRHAKKHGKFLRRIDDAIRDGLAWLAHHRSLRRNAGDNTWHRDQHYFYYLYSLERAFELSQIAWVDDWDWYFDGASLLIEAQEKDGRFGSGNLVDNCFAVLFLKKAQLPVLTAPR